MAQGSTGADLASLVPECPICMEIMRGARILICGHTYCQKCLEQEVAKSPAPHRLLTCFECRREVPLGEDGVNSLKRNFSIQAIIDKYDNMTVSSAEVTTASEPTPTEEKYTVKCDRHPNEVALFICETCPKMLICRVCTEEDHFQHHFVSIRGNSENCKALLMKLLEQHQKKTAQVIGRDQREATDSIGSNIQRLEQEANQTSAKKILAIQKERDKVLSLVQHIGQVMEAKTNDMYYNENPIDAIAEMVVRDNEYEITQGFEEAIKRLEVSLAEMEEKMSSSIMPDVAKCLSFKEEASGSSDAKLCELVMTNLCWKPATTYIDIDTSEKVLAFCYGPMEDWYVLSPLPSARRGGASETNVSLWQISKDVHSKKKTALELKGKPLDVVFTKSGNLCILAHYQKELRLTTVQGLPKRGTATASLPVKDFVNETLKIIRNPQDQICIPDTNGCGIWKVNVSSRINEKFSMGAFSPVNAASCGTSIYCITKDKTIIQRQEFPGSIPTQCQHDIKSGEPVQLLVDPKTNTLLVVHQNVFDTSNFELSIHQLGSSKPVVNPIKLSWVPSVTKADITHSGNLTVLLAKDQSGMIVEYKREDLPSLHDIPGLLPQD